MSDDRSGDTSAPQEQKSSIKEIVRELLREEPSLLTPMVSKAAEKPMETTAKAPLSLDKLRIVSHMIRGEKYQIGCVGELHRVKATIWDGWY